MRLLPSPFALLNRGTAATDARTTTMSWAYLVAAGFGLGLLVGRWWTMLAVVPFGIYMATTGKLEGNLDEWVAFVVCAIGAVAITAGVFVRRRGRLRRG